MKQTYFAIEVIMGSGKTMVMGLLGNLLETDGYKFNLVPKAINDFRRWKTYDPLVECYQNCNQTAAMAHMHNMSTLLRYYSQNILMARRTDSDLIVSDRSILSPPSQFLLMRISDMALSVLSLKIVSASRGKNG